MLNAINMKMHKNAQRHIDNNFAQTLPTFQSEYANEMYELGYEVKTSRVDMQFYHRKLRCLVKVDLKIGEFIPEYAGKMNCYLSVLDRTKRLADENASIGIILCAEKDYVQIELALEDMGKPIGVADYQLLFRKKNFKRLSLMK